MKAPLSWLKDYVDIALSPEKLGERLTEIGLGTEKITKVDGDVIFEFEITPNRPDLLSIVGIAREIAAIERKKIKLTIKSIPKPAKKLPIRVHNDFTLLQRYANVVIADITIKDSPAWLKNRLVKIGLRPINNVVDITNYVMFELGIPLHAFDYDEIHGKEFFIQKSTGGEKFVSVDQLSYTLPKDAIIIKDSDRIIDLVGIKGGLNSGIKNTTRNVLLQTSVDNPALIRRASQNLSLRSDASAILERGIDKNGLLQALSQAANLILKLAGGETASDVFDLKKKDFSPWKLDLRLERLTKILGIEIPEKKVLSILGNLNLDPHLTSKIITCEIPTYRNDLKIEEDLIEEVARMYGYNNFPKTMPIGEIPKNQTPYFRDYRTDEKVKNLLKASGFSEIYTYSLVGENDLEENDINSQDCLRVDNPVSREFEYLRPTLKINLLKALKQNMPNFTNINLFELGKVYCGKTIDKAKEPYFISGISSNKNFYELKGMFERLFDDLGIKQDPSDSIEVLQEGLFFELNYSELLENIRIKKPFIPLPKYPSIVEDISLIVPHDVKTGDIIKEIQKQNPLVKKVELIDLYQDSRTFHIVYQHAQRNLTHEEVSQIRDKILKSLEEKFGAKVK